jgi:hypothetical protein
MQMNHRRSIEKEKMTPETVVLSNAAGTALSKMSGDGYLFTSLHGVRYKGGVSFTRGYDSEQGSAACRC